MTKLKSNTLLLLKGISTSVIWLIGVGIGSLVASKLRLPVPQITEAVDPVVLFLLSIPAGTAISIVFGKFFEKVNLPFISRFLLIFLFNYLIYGILQVMEQIIFTSTMTLQYGIIYNIFPSFALSFMVTSLWKPKSVGEPVKKQFYRYLSHRTASNWLIRIVAAWLSYPLLYYLVGHIISPIVIPYYLDNGVNLGLVLPNITTIVLMQLLRGAIFLLAVVPVIVLWNGNSSLLWRWLGLLIFVQIAITPMVLAYWLPVGLRIPHAVELTVDSFVQAVIYTKLLFFKTDQ